jgi:dipeptidyl aminopeptidase/acylaminoacyl peptidase
MREQIKKRARVLLAAATVGAVTPLWEIGAVVDRILHPPRKSVPQLTTIAGAPTKLVSLRTKDGLVLHAWYVPPQNGATILLAHGHGENRAQMLPEAELLVRNRYGILAFDWRAHGGSDGDESTRGDKERMDLDAALEFLAGDAGARSGVVGALGFSRGGNVLAEIAPREPRIKAVVVEAIASSGIEGLRQDVGAWRMPFVLWALERKGVDIRARRPTIPRCDAATPMLAIVGANDESRPATTGVFDAACAPKELWIVPQAGHGGYAELARAEYERRVLSFFDRWLPERRP